MSKPGEFTMIELIYANRTENLLEKLACNLKKDNSSEPLKAVEIITPNRNMDTWVRFGLAEKLGISANMHFRRLESFIGNLVRQNCPGLYSLTDLDIIEGAILAALTDEQLLSGPALEPVRRYLYGTAELSGSSILTAKDDNISLMFSQGAELKRVQLASRLAYLFQEYTYSRPELIAAWRGDHHYGAQAEELINRVDSDPNYKYTAAWQKSLWQAVFGPDGILAGKPPTEGGRWATLDELLLEDRLFEHFASRGLPVIHIFGVSYVARLFQLLFARLGQTGRLKLYILNPCAEFWEDVETHRELFKRLSREKLVHRGKNNIHTDHNYSEDPFDLLKAENPALSYWGRPGREHVRLLGELTDCDFESAFSDPLSYGNGILHLLQQDILTRAPERNLQPEAPGLIGKVKPLPPDSTIKFVAAPSVRREVEWITEEIWRLIEGHNSTHPGGTLRFSDIAVIVNSAEKDLYLPQIESAFAACHNLPCSISDLPGTTGNGMVEAFNLLLSLPFSRFSRAEVLALLSHPSVKNKIGEPAPEDLLEMVERLGIVFGADRQDHEGTYIDEDVYNWDQGIRRLALGTFITGSKSGDNRIFQTEAGRWIVEETNGPAKKSAALFGFMVRSLINDCRYITRAELTLSDWSTFLIKLVDKYLSPDDGAANERLRLIGALVALVNMDFGRPIKGRTAIELAQRAISSLGSGRGQYLAEGVVVSSFLPMRAIPFKAIFLLGLGEGLFPAPSRRDALDLRSARRYAGDVDPAERDRYMFLETVLCARERLYISYVSRDEQTGEPLQPSAVIQELIHILEKGYLGDAGVESIWVQPPLRRHAEVLMGEDVFSDQARAEAHVQSIAENWLDRKKENLNENQTFVETHDDLIKEIKTILPEKQWHKLATILELPGNPDRSTGITTRFVSEIGSKQNADRETYNLPLSYLRRFLECPMQGWAAAMLGLSEETEDRAAIEEEDFAVLPLIETELLNQVYCRASTTGIPINDLYREEALFRRLQGRLPVGVLGEVYAKQHLEIFDRWTEALQEAFQLTPESSPENLKPLLPLQIIRFGSSPEADPSVINLDPPELDLNLPTSEGSSTPVKIRLTGLSQAFSVEHALSINLRSGKPPTGKSAAAIGRIFRYLLRGLIEQTVIAASNPAGTEIKQAISIFAGQGERGSYRKLVLRSPGREEALEWLGNVIIDLFSTSHAYLFPCEALFFEYYISGNTRPDGNKLQKTITALTRDEWNTFSSLWGPVPQPRTYAPPDPETAAFLAARRFGPLLDQITGMEGF